MRKLLQELLHLLRESLSDGIGGLMVVAIVALISAIYGIYVRYRERTPKPTTTHRPSASLPDFEQQLIVVNIILSEVDINKVRIWLRRDPAYQALAQNCLKLLEDKRIIDPIPLDVINGRYKELLGYAPDTCLLADKYNKMGKLKAAMFRAWKERHPRSSQRSFSEIVESTSES